IVTSFPFTTSPFSLVFNSQPTPAPWSALQIHVWSTIVSLLLILKFTLARPTAAPPTRKKTSCRMMGSFTWRDRLASGPTSSSTGDSFGPASKSTPAISIPSASAVVIAAVPFTGRSVAKPSPNTTVCGAVTVQVRNPHAELSRRIDLQERLLTHHRRLRHACVRRRRPCPFRWVHHADKHHVPVRARPTLPIAVA